MFWEIWSHDTMFTKLDIPPPKKNVAFKLQEEFHVPTNLEETTSTPKSPNVPGAGTPRRCAFQHNFERKNKTNKTDSTSNTSSNKSTNTSTNTTNTNNSTRSKGRKRRPATVVPWPF